MSIGAHILLYIYSSFMQVSKAFTLSFFNEFSLTFNEDTMYLYTWYIELVRGWGPIFSTKTIDKFQLYI